MKRFENFIPKDYFTLHALIPYQKQRPELWYSSALEAKRSINRKDSVNGCSIESWLENVAQRIANQPATVTESEQKQK